MKSDIVEDSEVEMEANTNEGNEEVEAVSDVLENETVEFVGNTEETEV